MRKELPIVSAPKDGRKITVVWIDDNDQRNESIGQFRSLSQLQLAGGDWDETDTGWWVYLSSRIQQKVDPIAWIKEIEGDDQDENE